MRHINVKCGKRITSKSASHFINVAAKNYTYTIDESNYTKEELVTKNLLFAVSVAKKYEGNGLPFLDILQACCLGMWEAAQSFDPTRGFKFISYAVYYMRKNIFEELNEKRSVIRLPYQIRRDLFKVNRIAEIYMAKTGEDVSKETLKDLHPEFSKAIDYYEFDKNISRTDEIKPNVNGGEHSFYDFAASDDKADKWNDSDQNKNTLTFLLKGLSERDKDILEQCIMHDVSRSVMARKYKITEERVRQIINTSLRRLKKKALNNKEIVREYGIKRAAS